MEEKPMSMSAYCKLILRLAPLGLIAAVLLAACGSGTSASDKTSTASARSTSTSGGSASTPAAKLNVVATTVQITALTREVGGDRIKLTGLIPAGADPHEFEPRPSDLTNIENAQ